MDAISVESLRKTYNETVALDDLDLSVARGEIFGFLGPNGAGKSTTIDLMLNYTYPTTGHITVLGHDAVNESRAVRRRVGVLSDGYALYDRLTGREHVETAIELKDASDDPDTILERVGVTQAADRPAGGYSKGMGQRLALGMALVGSPDLLVFDEPSTGLDPNGIRTLREIVREEADSGVTVFFSSHDLGQVEAVCDRVAILNEGRLVALDTVDGLRDRLGAAARLWIDADPLPDPGAIVDVEGVGSVAVEGGRLVADCEDGAAKFRALSVINNSGARLVDFETEATSLEDLFAASLDGATASVPAEERTGADDDNVPAGVGT